MICEKCGNDKFKITNVYRNTVRRKGRWVSVKNDTRLIICQDCGERYFTETKIIGRVFYDKNKGRRFEEDDDKNLFLFDEE